MSQPKLADVLKITRPYAERIEQLEDHVKSAEETISNQHGQMVELMRSTEQAEALNKAYEIALAEHHAVRDFTLQQGECDICDAVIQQIKQAQ